MTILSSNSLPNTPSWTQPLASVPQAQMSDYLQDTDAQGSELTLTTALLTRLAAGGPVLKFGVGSGRLAALLAQSGLAVSAIASSRMGLQRFELATGSAPGTGVLGDYATTRIEQQFSLVFMGGSRLYRFDSQEAQVACFKNAAEHLEPGGLFIVEAFVPDATLFQCAQEAVAARAADGTMVMRLHAFDPVRQFIIIRHIEQDSEATHLPPTRLRFVHPSEMDLMAQLAGLRRRARWGDWGEGPFTAQSSKQIAVYEKPLA